MLIDVFTFSSKSSFRLMSLVNGIAGKFPGINVIERNLIFNSNNAMQRAKDLNLTDIPAIAINDRIEFAARMPTEQELSMKICEAYNARLPA